MKTHWTKKQQNRLAELMADPSVYIGYWNSDAWGRAINGGAKDFIAKPGLMQEFLGQLPKKTDYKTFYNYAGEKKPGVGAFSATSNPSRWAGCRVWVVALHGKRHGNDENTHALKRLAPSKSPLPSRTPIRGLKASSGRISPNLSRAYLEGADLRGASLFAVNLSEACLEGANLSGAQLDRANLKNANLRHVHLENAGLNWADLREADLSAAIFYETDIKRAKFSKALRYEDDAKIPGYKVVNEVLVKERG